MNWNVKRAIPVLVAVVAIVLVLVVAARVDRQAHDYSDTSSEIVLFCDVSQRAVVNEIIEVFQRRSHVQIRPHFGASQALWEEFQQDPGAVDLFFPGDMYYVEQAQAEGLIEEASDIASTLPILQLRPGNPEGIESFEDLTQVGVRMGIAKEGTSLGRIMPEILERHGFTMADIRPNVSLTSDTELELGTAVRLGRIDGAIMWEPVARQCERSELVEIPSELNVPTPLGIGLSRHSADGASAREFMVFLGMRAAQARFEAHHYGVTPPES